MDQNTLIKSTLIGGCVGTALAMFFASKSSKGVGQSIVDTYHSINDRASGYVDEAKSHAQSLIDGVCDQECDDSHAFLYGTASGAIIGTIAALLLAPQSGEKLRQLLGKQYDEMYDKAQDVMQDAQKKGKKIESSLEDWKDTLAALVQKLTATSSKKKAGHSFIDEIVDWASLGLRFYNHMHARR